MYIETKINEKDTIPNLKERVLHPPFFTTDFVESVSNIQKIQNLSII